MLMRNWSLSIAALFFLGACGITINGNDTPTSNRGVTIHGYPILRATNITNTDSCGYGTPPTSLIGRWQVDRSTNGFTSHMVYDFYSGGVTMTNHCEYGGHWLQSTVSVAVTDLGIAVRFNNSADHTTFGYGMDCHSRADAGTVRYWFSGSCLVITDDMGETFTLVPSRLQI